MTADTATIIPLSAVPADMVEALLDRAFGPDRHARTAYRIRAGLECLDALSFAALDEEELLVATIQCWPVALFPRSKGGAETGSGSDPGSDSGEKAALPVPLIMVGPVAVLPERQGEGFGKGLMAAMIAAQAQLSQSGYPPFAQVLIGDADYYGRWGFSAAATGGWRCPGPYEQDRLLARGAALATMPPEGVLGPWDR